MTRSAVPKWQTVLSDLQREIHTYVLGRVALGLPCPPSVNRPVRRTVTGGNYPEVLLEQGDVDSPSLRPRGRAVASAAGDTPAHCRSWEAPYVTTDQAFHCPAYVPARSVPFTGPAAASTHGHEDFFLCHESSTSASTCHVSMTCAHSPNKSASFSRSFSGPRGTFSKQRLAQGIKGDANPSNGERNRTNRTTGQLESTWLKVLNLSLSLQVKVTSHSHGCAERLQGTQWAQGCLH